MRIGRIVWMLCMSILALSLQARPQGTADGEACGSLVFDSTRVDMGLIEKDSVGVAVFHFRVEGDAPVVIQRAATSCNCTQVVYPRTPLHPDNEGEITVCYNSQGLPSGFFQKGDSGSLQCLCTTAAAVGEWKDEDATH